MATDPRGGYFDDVDFLGDGKPLDLSALILPGMRVRMATMPGCTGTVLAVYYRGNKQPDIIRTSISGVGVIDLPETDVRPAGF